MILVRFFDAIFFSSFISFHEPKIVHIFAIIPADVYAVVLLNVDSLANANINTNVCTCFRVAGRLPFRTIQSTALINVQQCRNGSCYIYSLR